MDFTIPLSNAFSRLVNRKLLSRVRNCSSRLLIRPAIGVFDAYVFSIKFRFYYLYLAYFLYFFFFCEFYIVLNFCSFFFQPRLLLRTSRDKHVREQLPISRSSRFLKNNKNIRNSGEMSKVCGLLFFFLILCAILKYLTLLRTVLFRTLKLFSYFCSKI